MHPLASLPAWPAALRKVSLRATVRACFVLLLAALLAPAGAEPVSLRLTDQASSVDAWPAVRVLVDETAQLDPPGALARLSDFVPPATPHSNLGPRVGAVWVHVPLRVEADAPPTWMLRLQYALLHEVQVKVYDDKGTLVHAATLGARIPHAQREQPTRSLATLVRFDPSHRYDLLLRIETPTALLLPIAFMQHGDFAREESQELAWQGFMSGIWFFMAVYSLLSGLYHRQPSSLAYALAIASSWLFAQALFGVGPMLLWRESAWLAANLSVLSPLLMVAANAAFFISTLELRQHAPALRRALLVIGAIALVLAVLFITDRIGYRNTSVASMSLSVLELCLALPAIFWRVRQGDRPALFVLGGTLANLLGVLMITVLLRGKLPFSPGLLHAAQVCFALEMACWLLVLAARLEQMRSAAQAARHEHDTLRALAHTDELTGLLNRRGLELSLPGLLYPPRAAVASKHHPEQAVYLLDLDGFKPVNDQWGHETGDALLRLVAERLSGAVRPEDLVARLGGDEFVVAVAGLAGDEDAVTVGRKLLGVFAQPFDLGDGRQVHVGATIGCATTVQHGREAARLLRQADQAMYAGKQAGKRMLKLAPSVA